MSRLLNRQRQLAEQGRLRLGVVMATAGGKMRPKASTTWIVTSHSRDHVDTAAALWGGTTEAWQPQGSGAQQWRVITEASAIPAILPPGDPLTQAYETWSRGGCQRRCDGVTEQFSGSPCLCRAQFGEDWYEQPQGKVCDSKSRLKVILPDMPGLGTWRVETGSFYATDEIAGMVDFIRGAVGDGLMVPVLLRIEPRTRVAGGQTKQFVVPVLDLRGVTAGQIVSGAYTDIRQVEGARPGLVAIEAAAAADWVAMAGRCESLDAVRSIYKEAQEAGAPPEVLGRIVEIGKRLVPAPAAIAAGAPGVVEVDADAAWQQVLAEAGRRGIELAALEERFVSWSKGIEVADADGVTLAAFLDDLKAVSA